MNIRPFQKEDAEFCFRIRAHAFVIKFYDEIGPQATAACINAYMPNDYIRMVKETMFFIAERDGKPIGFFTIKRVDRSTAEIPLIYLDLDWLGKGVGKTCIRYVEKWIVGHWHEVHTLFLDTIIPKYNGGFYEKVGFKVQKETVCDFSGLKVKAKRYQKKL